MHTALVIIHIIITIALVGSVLMQRSEGGALGIGGGGTGGGMFTARGAADGLTKLTTVLAACFFATSIGLVLLASKGSSSSDESIFAPTADTQALAPLTNGTTDTQGAGTENSGGLEPLAPISQ